MMNQLIQEFPDQLEEAIAIGQAAKVIQHEHPIHHVLVCGLGGSGIGGNFVAALTANEREIPMLVSKGYQLPHYVGKNSLVIFSSYSGNTEETLAAFAAVEGTGAKVVCVASGGKLLEKAKEKGYDNIAVPAGKSSPRACLGYSIVQQLFVLNYLGIISDKTITEMADASDFIRDEAEEVQGKARHIANFLNGKIPVLYCTDRMEPVAIRLRQQINENAKMLCWHHVIPEMNHNELVGWRETQDDIAVLVMRCKDDFYRNQVRIDINKEIIGQYTGTLIEVYAKGKNFVEQCLYLVYLGDWISWYASELRGVDAIEIDVINYLKGELAKA